MTADEPWAALADLEDEEARREAIQSRLTALAEGPPSERDEGVGSLLEAEDSLSSITRQRLVLGRFQVWLTMPPEAVAALAASIATAREAMGGPAAMGSTTADQRAARELSVDEARQLVAILPSFRTLFTEQMLAAVDGTAKKATDVAEAPTPTAASAPRRPFWRFWDRGGSR